MHFNPIRMMVKPEVDNVNVHRAAAKIIVSKSRAARGSVCSTPDMGVILWGCKSPVHSFGFFIESHYTKKCKRQ